MDVLDKKTDKDLLQSLIAETAKAGSGCRKWADET